MSSAEPVSTGWGCTTQRVRAQREGTERFVVEIGLTAARFDAGVRCAGRRRTKVRVGVDCSRRRLLAWCLLRIDTSTGIEF